MEDVPTNAGDLPNREVHWTLEQCVQMCMRVCVCVCALVVTGILFELSSAGGQSHIAVDCPTKRATMWLISGRDAFWTYLQFYLSQFLLSPASN